MDWIRANKSLAAILGVAIAGAVGLGICLVLTYNGYSDSLDSLESLSKKIVNMEKAKLYPNEENLQAKEDKVSAYEDEVGKLGAVLLNLQKDVTTKPITDTDFQGKLKQRIVEFREKAETSRTALPKEFAFAFDSYTRSLPTQAATQDLNDYLDGVDAIVTAALDAGVSRIDSLQRTELAVEKDASKARKREAAKPAPAPPAKSKKKPGKKGAKEPKAAKAPVEITKVVEKRTVTLDVTADQAPLQALLNTLASATLMKHFTVLRVARIENEKLEGPLTNGKPKNSPPGYDQQNRDGLIKSVAVDPPPPDGAADKDKDKDNSKAEAIPVVKPEPPDAQKVLGGEMLKAHLEIDLIRFLEPDSGASSSGSAQ